MIIYLIYSAISLGFLLLFYHLFLEKEKMHSINRGYLIFSLIFSFTIPVIPVGMIDLPANVLSFFDQWTAEKSETIILQGNEWVDFDSDSATLSNLSTDSATINYSLIAWLIYLVISSGLFIRLIRILHRIQLKTDRNEKRLLQGAVLVLLNEDTAPHTFQNYIFLNKRRYLNGEIPKEVIIHEMTHARQKHSMDILFVEFLKILFWFNPLLSFYKKAILLNHEFLADEAVLLHGSCVKNYQKMLLKTLLVQPVHGLASTLNYSLTKKRLQMMTKSKSTYRSVLKLMIVIPLVASISLLPGCESTTTELVPEIETVDEVSIDILKDNTLMVNGNLMTLNELEKFLSELPEAPDLIKLKVNPEAEFGFITDVQQILRKNDALRITYSTIRGDQINNLELATNEFLVASKQYMDIEPNQSNAELLQEKYNEILELLEAIQEVEISDPNAPPPPPLVPSPEKRLNIEILTLPEAQTPPTAPIEAGNLIQILMNAQGLLLMNEEPVSINDLGDSIKEFVFFNEDPSRVVITVKTARNTPYDHYIELLDEIRAANRELKEMAAQKHLGVSYSSLEGNSSEKERIDELYYMRISISQPDN